MWYVKSKLESLEAIELELESQIILPYFQRLRLGDGTDLQLAKAKFIQSDNDWLLYNPSTATWCFINKKEYQICRSLLKSQKYSSLTKKFPEFRLNRLKRFLTHLYRRGLLKVNGQAGIETDIYANGPLFNKNYLIELLLTEKCNLACDHCFSEATMDRESMPLDIAYLTVDKAMDLPCKKLVIEFAGGETYIEFKELSQVVKYINKKASQKEKEVEIVIQSNGTLFYKHRILRFIDKYKLNPAVSMDGPPEINDRIRHFPDGRGSSDIIMKGVKRLRWYGFKTAPVLTVVSRINVGQPEKLIDYFTAAGLTHGMFNPILRLGRAQDNWQEYGISPGEYFQFMKRALEHSTVQGNVFRDLTIRRLLDNLIRRTRDFRCMRSPCGAGFDYIVMNPQGDIYPCAHHVDKPELRMGNIRDDELLNLYIIHNPVVSEMKLHRMVKNIPGCQECTWRHLCEGGCSLDTYFEYGTFYHPSPLCSFFKLVYPFLLKFMRRFPEAIMSYMPEAQIVHF